jgi:membrane protein
MSFHWGLFREAASEWSRHHAPRLGAALAYYTVLSLAPLLVVIVAVAGFAFGENAVRGQVYSEFKDLMGDRGAAIVQTLLKAAYRPGTGITASVLGFFTLLLGASGVFMELRDTLNYIWDAPSSGGFGVKNFLKYRFFSFAMVLGIGFLLMVSLVMSAIIQAAGDWLTSYLPVPAPVLEGINFLVTFIATTILFALMYRVIPEVHVDWEDVAIGSVITAALFAAGKFLIALYLGKAGVGSAYGAAGSLVVILVWVYYSSQIFLYGAEVTRTYARNKHRPRGIQLPAAS